jgi:hypothetical protein
MPLLNRARNWLRSFLEPSPNLAAYGTRSGAQSSYTCHIYRHKYRKVGDTGFLRHLLPRECRLRRRRDLLEIIFVITHAQFDNRIPVLLRQIVLVHTLYHLIHDALLSIGHRSTAGFGRNARAKLTDPSSANGCTICGYSVGMYDCLISALSPDTLSRILA